jgi:succinyl-CoA synthetase beta subunit
MDLYEHQGKELFRSVGLPTPRGSVAATPAEAAAVAAELGGRVVVKAQVLTGGRGKAGGIKVADDPEAARAAAEAILGMDIRGHVVRRVLVEEASALAREMYAAIVLDRGAKKALAMFSPMGGMDVEEIARTHPGAIARVHVDPLAGWSEFVGRRLVYGAGEGGGAAAAEGPAAGAAALDATLVRPVIDVFAKLYDAFIRHEATLVEINPLVVTEDGRVLALDAKFSVDNNALFRHPDIAAMRDVAAADPQEQMALERGVTYVKLDGTVGVLGNGAGLVMSTLDVVANAGGRAANFLDVGGGAKAEEIVAALEVITSDEKVRAIFFNIFGGITRCDEVARGVLTAVEQMGITMPIVVRLDGTNDVEGRQIIADARVPNLHVAATMLEAARLAVELAA